MRTEFLCISVLRVAAGPRVKLTSCKSALNPVVYSTDRSKAVFPVLVLLFVALRFILRGDLLCPPPPQHFQWSVCVGGGGGRGAYSITAVRTYIRLVRPSVPYVTQLISVR